MSILAYFMRCNKLSSFVYATWPYLNVEDAVFLVTKLSFSLDTFQSRYLIWNW